MPITQIAFDIPAPIQTGLDSGTLIRFGGVVRNQAGHIVTHLKEVPLPKADNSDGINKIVAFAKKNKYILIGTVFVTTAAAVGITYIVVKNKKNQKVKIPKCVADFNQTFIEYIDSIRNGSISGEKINKVIAALEEIKQHQAGGSIDISFSVENVKLLLDMIEDYTMKFAQANSFDLSDDHFVAEDELCGLKHYLDIQKQIFEICA